MRKRTMAREFAVQVLYQIDITHDKCEAALGSFWVGQEKEIEEQVKLFTQDLVQGTIEHVAAIDKVIMQYANNWQLKRMAVVDRNILRMGCYEILYREDIPPKVSINEAVELAKRYSGPEAGKFVNGILDKVKLEKNS
jgi:transcription antitermination factor NusB